MILGEPSLLSHLTEVRSRHIPEGGLSTVIFCGTVRNEATEMSTSLKAHRDIVQEEVNSESANVTGILVGQGNSVLHLLEGPSDSVLRILSRLSAHEHFSEPAIQAGRIVYCVEDRPQRYFPEWFGGPPLQQRESHGEDFTSETSKDVVHELSVNLFEIGKGLQLQMESHEEVELSRYALPGSKLVAALASSSDFFTLEEYVEVYAAPYHIELDTEKTFPLEKLVQY